MQLELINKKTLSVPLITNYKYKVNGDELLYINQDSLTYNFRNNIDSTIIKLDKDTCKYKPLYDIDEFVYYESQLYRIKDLDSNYNYTLHKEIDNNTSIMTVASVNKLKKLPLDIILNKIKSHNNVRPRTSTIDYLIDVDSSLTNQETLNTLIDNTVNKYMKSSYICKCYNDDHNSYNLIISLKAIDLKYDYKYILVNRYIKTLIYHENQITQINGIYNTFRFIIQTGSILTPALLSIQHIFGDNQPNIIYWITWIVSLIVGLLANYISLFGLDKKYFTYEKSYHLLVSYGWQFLQLSGKYGKPKDTTIIPTHDNMFNQFCDDIESLLLKEALSISDSMKEQSGTSTKTPKSKEKNLLKGHKSTKNK